MTLPKVSLVHLGGVIVVAGFILYVLASYMIVATSLDAQLETWTQRCRDEKKIAVQMRLVEYHLRSIGWACLTYHEFMNHSKAKENDGIQWKP